jgi:hypothetical protein
MPALNYTRTKALQPTLSTAMRPGYLMYSSWMPVCLLWSVRSTHTLLLILLVLLLLDIINIIIHTPSMAQGHNNARGGLMCEPADPYLIHMPRGLVILELYAE